MLNFSPVYPVLNVINVSWCECLATYRDWAQLSVQSWVSPVRTNPHAELGAGDGLVTRGVYTEVSALPVFVLVTDASCENSTGRLNESSLFNKFL